MNNEEKIKEILKLIIDDLEIKNAILQWLAAKTKADLALAKYRESRIK